MSSLKERLEGKLKENDEGCLVWTGSRTKGYGHIGDKGKTLRVHRVAWEMKHGPIQEGMVIDHLCRNKACCNVDHMEVVAQRTNIIRGDSPPAKNFTRTHCLRGHEFNETDTYTNPRTGRRHCRICRKLRGD